MCFVKSSKGNSFEVIKFFFISLIFFFYRTYSYTLPTVAFAKHNIDVDMETYRLPKENLKKVNDTLKLYEGTKNYHNFTSKKAAFDPSARRYLVLVECGTPFLINQKYEFATIKVKGQSFMLHQIRKMIGLALAVVRGLTSDDTIIKAFKEDKIDIPTAPSLGLVLNQVHYDRYSTYTLKFIKLQFTGII